MSTITVKHAATEQFVVTLPSGKVVDIEARLSSHDHDALKQVTDSLVRKLSP